MIIEFVSQERKERYFRKWRVVNRGAFKSWDLVSGWSSARGGCVYEEKVMFLTFTCSSSYISSCVFF